MREYLKESLHLLHLALFKPIILDVATSGWTKKQAIRVFLTVMPVQLTTIVTVLAFASVVAQFLGSPIEMPRALFGSAIGLIVGLSVGLSALGEGPVVGLSSMIGGGLVAGVAGGLFASFNAGLFMGVVLGAPLGFGFVDGKRRAWGVIAAPSILVIGWLVVLALLQGGPTNASYFVIGFAMSHLFVFLRPLHLVPHTFQLWRSKRMADPLVSFRNSPVYWDEAIALPLPYLSDWLLELTRFDRERGMIEIANVARLPYQRRAAQRSLIYVVLRDLQQADSFERMASAGKLLEILPSNVEYLPPGLNDVWRHIGRVTELASDYLTRVTTVGQKSVLGELRSVLESFRDAMVLVEPPVGPAFQSAASRWVEIVRFEEDECGKRIAFEPIPNPFVVGNPLMVRDRNLFKGRRDIIVAIEENVVNPAQKPTLLLYGRRRIGKTSTLLNLPRLLSGKFVPVFIDCQDAKWREGDGAFCYHLAASIHDALNQRALVETARRPQFERFERYAFTRLSEHLDQIEESSRAAHKQILLTFDEYEKLEDGVSKVTTEVLNQLRTIVKHRERIVVLFSGSHRFEEMRTINWSDYLINVKTLELSFLAPEDARELITEPVPLLQYESGVIEQIIELTHCQPYLLQAVASDLVNYLNSEKRMLATAADLGVAVESVLVTAQAYFFYNWTEDCTEPEREVLRLIATGDMDNHTLTEHQPSLQSLCHKEILERKESGYRFSIELFRRWVLKNQTAQAFTPGELPDSAELEYADLQTTHT